MPGPGGDTLASVAETLAGLTAAARAGSLDDTDALGALAAARQAAAELERSELALIEAARGAGPAWTRIAAAMGAPAGRPPRSGTRTSPAATRVHHRWTRQRRRSRMPGTTTTSRTEKRW